MFIFKHTPDTVTLRCFVLFTHACAVIEMKRCDIKINCKPKCGDMIWGLDCFSGLNLSPVSLPKLLVSLVSRTFSIFCLF